MSTIDDLQRLHDVAGPAGEMRTIPKRDFQVALHNAWPAIHRVLVAARKIVVENLIDLQHEDNDYFVCGTFAGKPCDCCERHDSEAIGGLTEALRALDDKEQRT